LKETLKAIVEVQSQVFKVELLAKTEEMFSKTEILLIL